MHWWKRKSDERAQWVLDPLAGVGDDRDRPSWDCTPLEGVGPLLFGMRPQQVAAALNNEVPATRQGHYPWPVYKEPGQWRLTGERYDKAGVTAHYWYQEGVPALGAVTVHGRTGPQVTFAGIRLIGRAVSTVEAALMRYTEDRDMGLVIGCGGDLGLAGFNMYVRATRAEDAVVSEARFCAEGWEDHG